LPPAPAESLEPAEPPLPRSPPEPFCAEPLVELHPKTAETNNTAIEPAEKRSIIESSSSIFLFGRKVA
jgi:hypothetical protein